jgi:SWI/SNF-related matrix-associated actin-dependent regulator 1 of chromatin subfamily A
MYICRIRWTPANISQAEDRAHRIGQKSSVNVYHYVIDGSIDCYLAKKDIRKQEIIDKSLNYKIESIDLFDIIDTNNIKNDSINNNSKPIEINAIDTLF